MNPRLLFLFILLASAFFCFAKMRVKQEPSLNEYANIHTIGILQTAVHPALDKLRESFKEKISKKLGGNVQFVEQNGLGQMSSLQMMAQNLHRNVQIELFLAIGTPAVQVMIGAEQKKPIVFAAVTDPSVLKLDPQRNNVYGVSDSIDASEQIAAIRKTFGQIKKIGLLYNTAESNSLSAIKKIEIAIQKEGLEFQHVGIQSMSDLPQALESACRKCDLILAPTDNLVAMSMPLIARIASVANCPIVASDVMLFGPGLATAAFGVDYQEAGDLSAELALLLIQNQLPEEKIVPMKASWFFDSTPLENEFAQNL